MKDYSPEEYKKIINDMRTTILKHQIYYYIESKPKIPDSKYDTIFNNLIELEKKYPEFNDINSPTKRIGSDLNCDLPETKHTINVLSLGNVYSTDELVKWLELRTKDIGSEFEIVIELKIDGLSIVLYYEEGNLIKAVTRGNGVIGNDIIHNVRTIKTIPLMMSKKINLVSRGEIYLPKDKFKEYNKKCGGIYANARNLAAGTVRRKKSENVASVPLSCFIYEGYFDNNNIKTHQNILEELQNLGFNTNPNIHIIKSSEKISKFIEDLKSKRDSLNYDIDGLVIKINDLSIRNKLGETSHHPKWAISLKFEAPQCSTVVKDITIQVGRTGRITPVTFLKPVFLSGSTIKKATLHNQDYVNLLEIAKEDTVSISKRGDVIPAVEEVLIKNTKGNTTFKFPTTCPSCSSLLVKDGVHIFCKSKSCPDKRLNQIIFFIEKRQMDIRNLGKETIETLFKKDYLKSIPDLYEFDYSVLMNDPGFGKRKIEIIIAAITKSKSQPFHRVLPSIGMEEIGHKVTELLIKNGYKSFEDITNLFLKDGGKELLKIDGFGEKTVETMKKSFLDADNISLINNLIKLGLSKEEKILNKISQTQLINDSLKGTTWVVTGSFEKFKPRELAKEEIVKRGGSMASGISKKITHLLVGEKPGNKVEKANQLGNIKIIKEDKFLELLI